MSEKPKKILLTGATGYVGGRLLTELEERGHPVRCLARKPEFLRERVGPETEVVRGDVLEPDTLGPALEGIDCAYYLVHSMDSSGEFVEQDRRAAENFGRAAREKGVRRLVYLGGLGHETDLSDHLASRHEVGRVLRESGVPTIELRASIIIGSGSLSFELIRALVEKLPVMITPRWVRTRAQPIAIEDVIAYLLRCFDLPDEPAEQPRSRIFEIGGADRASYGDIMNEYARQRGLTRWIIPVPVLSSRLSSLWLGLVTPLYARVGRKLIDSMRHPTVVEDPAAREVFDIEPLDLPQAISRALLNEDRKFAQTRWNDALSARGSEGGWGGVKFGSRLVDSRTTVVPVSAGEAFAPIRRIGGETGYYSFDWLWWLRGFLDLLVGGPGMRRGRRDPDHLVPGDTVDFWRVEKIQAERLLLLRAEMRVPGRAWLQFELEPAEGGTRIRQTAIFDPVGLPALLYWYSVWPMHQLIFSGMLRGIAREAEKVGAGEPEPGEAAAS